MTVINLRHVTMQIDTSGLTDLTHDIAKCAFAPAETLAGKLTERIKAATVPVRGTLYARIVASEALKVLLSRSDLFTVELTDPSGLLDKLPPEKIRNSCDR